MSKRKYTRFKSEYNADLYIDLSSVESFDQDGEVLIVHKDSGLFNRIVIQTEEFRKLLDDNKA